MQYPEPEQTPMWNELANETLSNISLVRWELWKHFKWDIHCRYNLPLMFFFLLYNSLIQIMSSMNRDAAVPLDYEEKAKRTAVTLVQTSVGHWINDSNSVYLDLTFNSSQISLVCLSHSLILGTSRWTKFSPTHLIMTLQAQGGKRPLQDNLASCLTCPPFLVCAPSIRLLFFKTKINWHF